MLELVVLQNASVPRSVSFPIVLAVFCQNFEAMSHNLYEFSPGNSRNNLVQSVARGFHLALSGSA